MADGPGFELDRREIITDYLNRTDNMVKYSKGVPMSYRKVKGLPAGSSKKTVDDYVQSARKRREKMNDFITRSEHKVIADGLAVKAETAKQYADEKRHEARKAQSSARLRIEFAKEEYKEHEEEWERAEAEAQRLEREAHIAWLISQGIDPWKVDTPPILEEPEPTPPPTPKIEIDESSFKIDHNPELPIEDWSKERLAAYLKCMDMEPVADIFMENFIDGMAFKAMSDETLEQLIADVPHGMQLKMRKLMETVREGLTPKFPDDADMDDIPYTAEEARASQEKLREAEAKAAELERLREEQQKQVEQMKKDKKEAEAKINKISEEKRIAEEERKKAEEEKRKAEERANKMEEEKRKLEEREKKATEEKRLAEEKAAKLEAKAKKAEEKARAAEEKAAKQAANLKQKEEDMKKREAEQLKKEQEQKKRDEEHAKMQKEKEAAELLLKKNEEVRIRVMEEKKK